MYHTAGYVVLTAGASTNLDTPAIADTVVGIRNNHFILQYPMRWQWLSALGITLTQARISSPTLSAFGFPQLWPVDAAAAVLPLYPDRPAIVDMWPGGLDLPLEEELAVQVTTTGVAERDLVVAWFTTPDHQLTIPPGMLRLILNASYTVTPAAIYTWTGPQTITFSSNLRGGWWQMNGMFVLDALAVAARIIFPNPPSYMGMPLRPGCLVQTAAGNRPSIRAASQFGVMGYFNTTVPPSIEILASTVGARTGQIFMDLTYLGLNPPPGYH